MVAQLCASYTESARMSDYSKRISHHLRAAKAALRNSRRHRGSAGCQRALKTSHFESGIAQQAATAALMRDEPTHCELAIFHCHAGGQRLVGPPRLPANWACIAKRSAGICAPLSRFQNRPFRPPAPEKLLIQNQPLCPPGPRAGVRANVPRCRPSSKRHCSPGYRLDAFIRIWWPRMVSPGAMMRLNVLCAGGRSKRSRPFAGWNVRRGRSCRWILDREPGCSRRQAPSAAFVPGGALAFAPLTAGTAS
jgi:hypothetical protein